MEQKRRVEESDDMKYKEDEETNKRRRRSRKMKGEILFYGDSLTYGMAHDCCDRYDTTWPRLLENQENVGVRQQRFQDCQRVVISQLQRKRVDLVEERGEHDAVEPRLLVVGQCPHRIQDELPDDRGRVDFRKELIACEAGVDAFAEDAGGEVRKPVGEEVTDGG